MDRTKLVGWALAFLFFAGGVGAGTIVDRMPMTAAEGLSFGGTLAGAFLAVIGALAVVEVQRTLERREHIDTIAALIHDAKNWCDLARQPTPIDKDMPFCQSEHAKEFADAVDRLKRAKDWFPPKTIGMAKAFTTIARIEVDIAKIEDALHPAKMYPETLQKTDLDPFLKVPALRLEQALHELMIDNARPLLRRKD